MNAKTLATTTLAAVLAMGTSVAAQAAKPGFEKCAGVVKAGMNDCATAGHSCAGQSSKDGDADEWVYVPEGTCTKLVGGTVK